MEKQAPTLALVGVAGGAPELVAEPAVIRLVPPGQSVAGPPLGFKPPTGS